MDTAGSIATTANYYESKAANAVLIRPEDGDIRVFIKTAPTSTLGNLLKSGVMYYFAGIDLTGLNLIRTSGTNVNCSVQVGNALSGESGFSAVADTISVAIDEFPAASAASDNYANPTTTDVKSFGMVWDGATWDRAKGDSTDGALVNLGANNDVTVGGDVANDAVDSGNPVKIGGVGLTANPTKVATGDRVNAMYDLRGKVVTSLNAPRELIAHQHTEIVSSSAETTVLTAGAAEIFHDLTELVVTNQTATAVNLTIKDATAGTTRMIIALSASGGAVIPFPTPVTQATAANNWTVTLSSAAVTVDIFVQAVKNN